MLNPNDFIPTEIESPIVKPKSTTTDLNNIIEGAFLKGPIPMSWLNRAAAASGKGAGLAIGIAIWHIAGMEKSNSIKLRPSLLERMNINRFAKSRGLKSLKNAGLISIINNRGQSPTITILV